MFVCASMRHAPAITPAHFSFQSKSLLRDMSRILFLLLVAGLALPAAAQYHSADTNKDYEITLSELLRVIQFYNSGEFHCALATEDGYAVDAGSHECAPHSSDYAPRDWRITLVELLRLVQFYNSGGYHPCPGEGTEDGFCPGP